MSLDTRSLHRYMLVLNATFVGPEGQPGFKTVNTVVARSQKTLPLGIIKQAQDGVVMQLQMFGIDASSIVDVSFVNAVYLGSMTEKEFTEGLPKEMRASVTMSQSKDDDFVNPLALKGH